MAEKTTSKVNAFWSNVGAGVAIAIILTAGGWLYRAMQPAPMQVVVEVFPVNLPPRDSYLEQTGVLASGDDITDRARFSLAWPDKLKWCYVFTVTNNSDVAVSNVDLRVARALFYKVGTDSRAAVPVPDDGVITLDRLNGQAEQQILVWSDALDTAVQQNPQTASHATGSTAIEWEVPRNVRSQSFMEKWGLAIIVGLFLLAIAGMTSSHRTMRAELERAQGSAQTAMLALRDTILDHKKLAQQAGGSETTSPST